MIAVAIFVTFAITASEYFLTLGNLENVARQISLDAPLVFGQAIVLIAGGIDISVGADDGDGGGADHRPAALRDARPRSSRRSPSAPPSALSTASS